MRTNVVRTVTTPDGEAVSLEEWARRNNADFEKVRYRWYAGTRDPWALVENADRRRRTDRPPVLTPEKRAELLELAKYSMGQPDQKFILCDFMPCERSHADWLMEELGL